MEDISDESYLMRHRRCEIGEKKKFMSYMIAQRRGRGHRTDSTTEGTDGPRPDTPSLNASASTSSLHATATSSSLTSPLLQPQLSALASSADDDEAVLASYELARQRRSNSVSSGRSRSVSVCDDKHLEEYNPPPVAPWHPRKFPLTNEDCEKLLQEHPLYPSSRLELKDRVLPSAAAGAPSPAGSGGSDTSSAAGDDPNDPEWTVDDNADQQQQQQSKLVLRLTKR